MASPKAIEAARAVNSLLHLSSSDQEALLGVVEDYFTSPDEETQDSDWDASDDSSDTELYTADSVTFLFTIIK